VRRRPPLSLLLLLLNVQSLLRSLHGGVVRPMVLLWWGSHGAERIMALLWGRTVEDPQVLERVLPQLYHVHLISRLRPGPPLQLPPHLADRARDAWHRNCLKTTTSEYQVCAPRPCCVLPFHSIVEMTEKHIWRVRRSMKVGMALYDMMCG
jgi:hypothetical protein